MKKIFVFFIYIGLEMREREAILAFVGLMVFYDLLPSISCPEWDELLQLNNITEFQENLIEFNKVWNTPIKTPLWFLKPYRMSVKCIELSNSLEYFFKKKHDYPLNIQNK